VRLPKSPQDLGNWAYTRARQWFESARPLKVQRPVVCSLLCAVETAKTPESIVVCATGPRRGAYAWLLHSSRARLRGASFSTMRCSGTCTLVLLRARIRPWCCTSIGKTIRKFMIVEMEFDSSLPDLRLP
jgi:hypothetical protein